ncbi:unnamed protein product [Staurois parvus]|uniref:Uncharacterized protein n=1 Tax=Staurois parvus TaxID=386267 RepID=A0ABN9FYG1_9NEOB|nr:unnamed protein product [Staurois parvus]
MGPLCSCPNSKKPMKNIPTSWQKQSSLISGNSLQLVPTLFKIINTLPGAD